MFGLRYDNLMDLCLALITATQRLGKNRPSLGYMGSSSDAFSLKRKTVHHQDTI